MSKIKLYSKVLKLFLQRKTITPAELEKSYDRISDTYDNLFLRTMHKYNDELLSHLISTLNRQDEKVHILDLAAGTGYNADFIIRSFQEDEAVEHSLSKVKKKDAQSSQNEKRSAPLHEVILVDISKEMLQRAKEKLGNRVQYIKSDMLHFLRGAREESFDAIICTWAIKYQDPAQIILECKRILKPGGIFAVLVNTKQTLPEVRKIYPSLLEKHTDSIEKVMLELPNPKHSSELDEWFRKAGFTGLFHKSGQEVFTFHSAEELTQFVTSTGALAGFDRMIDLKNQMIQEEMTELFQEHLIHTATHHFVYGVYQK